MEFRFVDGAKETNTLELKSDSSQSALNALHLSAGTTMSGTGKITSSAEITKDDLFSKKSTADVLAGATMNVTYNGTRAKIKMPEKGTDEYNEIFVNSTSKEDAAQKMQAYLQTQFDQAFGYNRVHVSGVQSDGTFKPTFELVSAGEGDTLSINSGTLNVIGKGGIFGIDRGASNRVNTSKTLGELYGLGETSTGFTGLNAVQNEDGSDKLDENGNKLYALEINGVKIGEYSVDTTLGTIMNDINKNEKAGVKVSYSTTSNQFVFTSTHGGSGGRIEIGDDGANLAAKLFGAVEYDGQGNIAKVRGQEVANSQGKDFSVIQGQDARWKRMLTA